MAQLEVWLNSLVGVVWNWPVVILCLGAGFFLTVFTGFVQFRGFGLALDIVRGKYDSAADRDQGNLSHAQALFGAISATVGLGNIAGVAIAIVVGGPGALLWMWLIGLLGMATKFAECSLGTLYRERDSQGTWRGGPIYYITRGLPESFPNWGHRVARPMAATFAVLCIFGAFGGGNMFQANQVAQLLQVNFHVPPTMTGIVLAALVGTVIIGGIRRIGQVVSLLVPFMCGIYVLAAFAICLWHIADMPQVLAVIFSDAFSGEAAAGGVVGTVIITGIRRAVFSSEAGIGSAPMMHATARCATPIRQGYVALLEPFLDTIVVCSATGFVIVLSGLYGSAEGLGGAALTATAFEHFLPGFGRYFLVIAASMFAFSTAITWFHYSQTSARHLFGDRILEPIKWLFVAAIFVGAVWKLEAVIAFTDIAFGLMVIPNLIAVLLLSGRLRGMMKEFEAERAQLERQSVRGE